jgi:hypothetical protein
MKRDLDLVRQILLEIEKSESKDGSSLPSIDGVEPDRIAYHVDLMMQAGWLTGDKQEYIGGPPEYSRLNLTWHGHDYLDAVRERSVWADIKKIAAEKGISLTIEVAKDLGVHLAKRAVGLNSTPLVAAKV